MTEEALSHEQLPAASPRPEAARGQPIDKRQYHRTLYHAFKVPRDLNVYGYIQFPFRSPTGKEGEVITETYSRESTLWLEGHRAYHASERRIRASCRQEGMRDESMIQSRIIAEVQVVPWANILLQLQAPGNYFRLRDLVKLWPRLVRRAKDLMAPLPRFKPTVISRSATEDFMSSERTPAFEERQTEAAGVPLSLNQEQKDSLGIIEECLGIVLTWENPSVVYPLSATCLSDRNRHTIEQVISEIRRARSPTATEPTLDLIGHQMEGLDTPLLPEEPAQRRWRWRQIPSWFRTPIR